jgi:endoglucanase
MKPFALIFGIVLSLSIPAKLSGQDPVMPIYPAADNNEKDTSLVLKEIRTASDNVVVALFNSDIVDLNGVDTSDPSLWKLDGKPVKAIYKFVTEADASEHHIYLEVPKLENGKLYALQTPYGNRDFRFDDKKTFCESIKTNQAGYSALSKVRYANFAIWLGDGGVRQIEGPLPHYSVFDQDGKQVAEGTLQEVGQDKSSGDFVYRIDLSSVPEGGPYTISIKGYGASYPFGVGGSFSRNLAWTSFRALYHQRCGVPIIKPYAEWDIRTKPCHETVYLTYGPIGEARLKVTGEEPSIKAWGGYHDAGDADRRTYHMNVPSTLLTTFEAFPEYFKDDQFNIPDIFDENFYILGKGNGIPDILDEAEWGTMFWEYVQTETGEIPWGTETTGYSPFTTYDREDHLFGTEVLSPISAAWASGLFVHLARLIEPYKPERAAQLMERSALARKSLEGQAFPTFDMYWNVEMYLKTGESQYHDYIKAHAADVNAIVGTYNMGTEAFARNAWLPSYFCSYIFAKERETDPTVRAIFIDALKRTADKELDILAQNAYPVGTPENLRWWGSNVAQGQYAYPMMLYWRLSGEQKYIDGVSQLMDYALGLNPLGKCFMTGVGYNRVHHPHDRETEYTNHEMGWGIRPGLIVFGPGLITNAGKSYPAIDRSTPRERIYIDNLMAISQSEFTIYQSLCFPANVYPILTGGSEYDR